MSNSIFKPDRSYRPDEIAVKLAISQRTVYRMIKDVDDPLPAVRVMGRSLRVEGKDLISYLERRRVRPEDE